MAYTPITQTFAIANLNIFEWLPSSVAKFIATSIRSSNSLPLLQAIFHSIYFLPKSFKDFPVVRPGKELDVSIFASKKLLAGWVSII